MAEGRMGEDEALPAGDFSSWLAEIQGVLRGERGSEVPCDGCTACCTSSQFVHVEPDEMDTLSHIPPDLLFPAPLLPPGHVLLGYDERGHCPMLIDNRCSIYAHRPRTCRAYDCRIFAAAGLKIHNEDTVMIARRAESWRFSFATEADSAQHDAIGAAANFLHDNPGVFPAGSAASSATEVAILALEIHETFLDRHDETLQARVVEPDPEVVRVELLRRSGPPKGPDPEPRR